MNKVNIEITKLPLDRLSVKIIVDDQPTLWSTVEVNPTETLLQFALASILAITGDPQCQSARSKDASREQPQLNEVASPKNGTITQV